MNISFSIGLFFSFHPWKQKDAMITSGSKCLPPRIDSDFPPTCAQRRRPSSESNKKSSAKKPDALLENLGDLQLVMMVWKKSCKTYSPQIGKSYCKKKMSA